MPVGGPRQRCVLGALLVDLGKEVTVERLIEYLWSDDPPRTARAVVQVQISHLRRSFPDLIDTTAGGYLARIEPDRVDLHRFRGLVGRATTADDPVEALRTWGKALGCWRGEPFSGTGSDQLFYAVVQPLLEERWAAITGWAECAFRLRRYPELVSRLTSFVHEDPLRERLQYLLIASLHRSGQRATALTVFHDMRRHLAEELGVSPSPDMQKLHQAILRDEHGAESASGAAAAPTERPEPIPAREVEFVRRNDLPRDMPDFTGREADERHLLDLSKRSTEQAQICVITGTGGVGKTALAVHAAHLAAEDYPDGQLFIDLCGYTSERRPLDARSALESLLRAVGVESAVIPETLEERSALWRATVADRRLLIILDNVSHYAQVSPLLPAAPGSLTLVTTRNDLPGLGGTSYLSLDMLSRESAVELFSKVLGTERVNGEHQDAARTADMCGGLPLALRIVAGRMLSRPRWTFAHVVRRLGEQRRTFNELRIDGQSVEAVFEMSYQSLTVRQREVFLLLGGMIGNTVDLRGASAMLDLDPPDADDVLQELVSMCLLEEPAGDVYRFHDLIGAYSLHKAKGVLEPGTVQGAQARLADHYLETAHRAADLMGLRGHHYELNSKSSSRYDHLLAGRREAEAWFDLHQNNLAEVVNFYAARGSGDEAWQLADSVWRFYALRGKMGLLVSSQEKALSASRLQGNKRGEAVTLIGMGIAECLAGRFDTSISLLKQAHDLLEEVGDERGRIRALANLGMAYEKVGDFRQSLSCFQGVLRHAVKEGDGRLECLQRANISFVYKMLGDYDAAVESAEASMAVGAAAGAHEDMALPVRVIGEVKLRRGDLDAAVRDLDELLRMSQEFQSAYDEVFARNCLGVAQRESGDPHTAVESHTAALEVAERSGLHSADAEILNELGVTYIRAGRHKDALASLDRAHRLAAERGERYTEARALLGLGMLPADVVEPGLSLERLITAAAAFEDLGVPEAEQAHALIRRLRGGP